VVEGLEYSIGVELRGSVSSILWRCAMDLVYDWLEARYLPLYTKVTSTQDNLEDGSHGLAAAVGASGYSLIFLFLSKTQYSSSRQLTSQNLHNSPF
jgi:hypothetical protein